MMLEQVQHCLEHTQTTEDEAYQGLMLHMVFNWSLMPHSKRCVCPRLHTEEQEVQTVKAVSGTSRTLRPHGSVYGNEANNAE
jgi:hypothetical protein